MANKEHEIDNELLNLLDDLEDGADDVEKGAVEAHQESPIEDQPVESSKEETEEPQEDHPEEPSPDTPELDKIEEKAALAPSDTSEKSVDLKSIFSDFNSVKDLLLDAFKEDRDALKEHIKWFEGKVKGDSGKEHHVKGLTSLLATKANSASQAIKLLDSIAHIVSASKNHTGLSGGSSGMPMDLDTLLSDDFDQDAP